MDVIVPDEQPVWQLEEKAKMYVLQALYLDGIDILTTTQESEKKVRNLKLYPKNLSLA